VCYTREREREGGRGRERERDFEKRVDTTKVVQGRNM